MICRHPSHYHTVTYGIAGRAVSPWADDWGPGVGREQPLQRFERFPPARGHLEARGRGGLLHRLHHLVDRLNRPSLEEGPRSVDPPPIFPLGHEADAGTGAEAELVSHAAGL